MRPEVRPKHRSTEFPSSPTKTPGKDSGTERARTIHEENRLSWVLLLTVKDFDQGLAAEGCGNSSYRAVQSQQQPLGCELRHIVFRCLSFTLPHPTSTVAPRITISPSPSEATVVSLVVVSSFPSTSDSLSGIAPGARANCVVPTFRVVSPFISVPETEEPFRNQFCWDDGRWPLICWKKPRR